MSALSLSFLGFGALTIGGWRMWDVAGTFQEAFRALVAMYVGGYGMAGCAIWWVCTV